MRAHQKNVQDWTRLAPRPSLIAVAALLGLSFAAERADAFSAQGQRWVNQEGNPVTYQLDPAGSEDVTDESELAAIRRGFATWESVACSFLSFQEQAHEAPSTIGNNAKNQIFWAEEPADWPGNQGTLALTYTFYTLDAARRITDADIVVNGVNWTWTTVDSEVGQGSPAKVDVETVMFHEAGHFFGLDHSQDETAAMFSSNNKLTQRSPANDDIQGICALYSNGQAVPGAEPGQMGAPVGAPCLGNNDCASAICVSDGLLNQTYCSAQCSLERQDECPAGFNCESTQNGGLCLAPAPVDELCDLCNEGSHCASGLCVSVQDVNYQQPFCSKPCDPTPGQPAQCPEGFNCEVTFQGGGQNQIGACVPATGICEPRGKGGQNEPCYANGACKPGHRCIDYYPEAPESGISYCYGLCDIQYDGLSCGLDRSRCTAIGHLMGVAACLTVAAVGQPCIPEVCDQFGFCAWDENVGVDSAVCYQTCGNTQCQPNFSCQTFPGLPPLCVPNAGFKFDGDSCAGNAECESGLCQNLGAPRLCTRTCSTNDQNACQPGLRCIPEPGSAQGLCWPESLLDPNAKDPTRDVNIPGYCSCDFSNTCDAGCECDPECAEGCTCAATHGVEPYGLLGLALIGALGLLRRRRRRG